MRGAQKSGQAGVALIEALISILIFSFGVLGLVGLEASAINFSVDAEDRSRATVLANDIVSTMWLNLGSTTFDVSAQRTACAPGGEFYLPSCTITGPTLVTGTTNTYTITITWVPLQDKTGTTRTLTTQVTLT